jgi:hypothetical protein
MGQDYSGLIYAPTYDVFARQITVTPVISQPAAGAYTARGIYDTQDKEVPGENGTIFVDQETILDILESEFPTLPTQKDLIDIPNDGNVPAEGSFEVMSSSSNGGGETTLVIRKIATVVP